MLCANAIICMTGQMQGLLLAYLPCLHRYNCWVWGVSMNPHPSKLAASTPQATGWVKHKDDRQQASRTWNSAPARRYSSEITTPAALSQSRKQRDGNPQTSYSGRSQDIVGRRDSYKAGILTNHHPSRRECAVERDNCANAGPC